MTTKDAALPDSRTLRKVIFASAIGNFVEWFDFAIYGFLAVELARLFFPESSATAGLLNTFAIFAVSFALRPLGGIFFGMLGDKIGRKKVLAITILLMASATTFIGAIPTYVSIGIAAPILLALARCIQGFSAGGEYAGVCAFVIEHTPTDRKARYASFIPVSTFLAFACASLLILALRFFMPAELIESWGWRLPFLIAAPLGLIGLYIRLRLDESPAFKLLAQEPQVPHSPLGTTLRTHGSVIARLTAFISLTALSFYTFTTYLASHMQKVGNAPKEIALLASMGALIFAGVLCPFIGRYTDFVGRRMTVLTACLSILLAIYPAFILVGTGVFWYSMIGAMLLAVGAVICGVVTAVLLAEQFPTRVRYTAASFSYNIAYTLFGGTAPYVATWLVANTENPMAPAWYLAVIAVIALIAGITLPETSKRPLNYTP